MTIQPEVIYLIVSGAASARFVPDLLEQLPQFELPIYTLMTDNAQRLISPRELAILPGHRFIDSYFDHTMFNARQSGLTLVAPATFNTFNKIGHGLADTLAHSLVAEAIGADWPVIIAPSVNPGLGNHPQFKRSLATLREWGVTVLEPRREGELLLMASIEEIVESVRVALDGR